LKLFKTFWVNEVKKMQKKSKECIFNPG